MASDPSENLERLINSRNRDLALFLPFFLAIPAVAAAVAEEQRTDENPDEETPNATTPHDRIIFVNPITQSMFIVEGGDSAFDSLFRELSNKNGHPPASKSSIEALNDVVIETDSGCHDCECVICLNEWKIGESVKEMPCKHKFCSKCIEKWLRIHGSCPVCRYKMPVDDQDHKNGDGEGEEEEDQSGRGRRRRRRRVGRDIWVTFSLNHPAADADADADADAAATRDNQD